MAKWAGSLSATTPSKSKMIARSIVGHKSSETHPRTFEGSTRRIVESVKRGGIIAQASTRETFRGGPAGPSWLRLQPLFLNPALSSIFSPDRIDPCVVPELTVDHGHRGARADGEAAAGSPCFNGEWDRSGRESRIGKHHDAPNYQKASLPSRLFRCSRSRLFDRVFVRLLFKFQVQVWFPGEQDAPSQEVAHRR